MQQSTPTTWCCHPRASWLGWCSSVCKPPPFSSKHNDGHYGQTVLFLFHQTRGHFSKKYDLCLYVQLQTVVCLFYGDFGAAASSLLSGLSGYVDIGLVLLWRHTSVPISSSIFTRSFAVVLGLICTFRTKVHSSLFFWFSHDVKQRSTVFEGRPWNTCTGTPPIYSNDVN